MMSFPLKKSQGNDASMFKTTPLLLFIKTKKGMMMQRSSEKCEAHLLNCLLFPFHHQPLCLVPVLCGYLNFQRTVGYGFVFSMFQSLERAVQFQFFRKIKEPSVMGLFSVCSDLWKELSSSNSSKNQRTVGYGFVFSMFQSLERAVQFQFFEK
jgi:hypothetical protein